MITSESTNEEVLELIRKERPNQVIHEVISFVENEYGFWDVYVDMESTYYFATTVKHTRTTLPYPMSAYEKLSTKEQFNWRMK